MLAQLSCDTRAIALLSQPSASVPPLVAFGTAFAAGVAVAISSAPPCWWLAAWAPGANSAGLPLMLAHVRSVSRAIVLFSQPSAIFPPASAVGTALAVGVVVMLSRSVIALLVCVCAEGGNVAGLPLIFAQVRS